MPLRYCSHRAVHWWYLRDHNVMLLALVKVTLVDAWDYCLLCATIIRYGAADLHMNIVHIYMVSTYGYTMISYTHISGWSQQ